MSATPFSTTRLSARDLAQIAVFAALIVALGLPGQITIGSSGVPITLQSMGVMLAGAILGARKGTFAVVAVIVLSIAGLPILAGGRTGLTSLSAPTAGFLIGWIPAALVIGLLTSRMMPNYRFPTGFAINIVGGIVVMYLFGITGMLLRTDMGAGAAVLANVAFIPGDVVKAIITAAVAAQVHRAYPGVIPARRRRREPVPSAG